MKLNRKTFLQFSFGQALIALLLPESVQAKILPPTPEEIEGPFYPVVAQADKDFDLTRIKGHTRNAEGQAIYIEGQVIDTKGKPLPSAIVDIWQANTFGRYNHPLDPNPATLDPHFQGWAIVSSGQKGQFKFKTILPGPYPATKDWTRPPHIHFKVSKRGYEELTTQLYFPGQELNRIDRLLQSKSPREQQSMVATSKGLSKEGLKTFFYQIVLKEL